MPDRSYLSVDYEVDTEAWVQRIVKDEFSDLASTSDEYAAWSYLASIAFLRYASGVKAEIIVRFREDYPGDSYEQTAERLGISVATVNRAIVAHNRRAATA